MASGKTEHYGLNQWEATDKVERLDFNADNAKIDAALKASGIAVGEEKAAREAAVTELTAKDEVLSAAVAKRGNCQVVCGSYIGNNTYGSANPNTLSFDYPPACVVIRDKSNGGDDVQQMVLIRNCPTANGSGTGSNTDVNVTWSGNSVRWYGTANAYAQYNVGHTYYYVALLMADR